MTKISFRITLILLVLVAGIPSISVFGQQKTAKFTAATFNIRYDAKADAESGNAWEQRKAAVFNLIKKHDFDIFATQEGMFKQMVDFKKHLPTYDYLSYPYGGRNDHHQAAVVYKRALFEAEDAGVFWLSETPLVPSIGWDASDRRICQWVKFKHKPTGKIFYFFNAHFYWRNQIAKQQSGALIAKMVREIAGDYPVICVGDFNSTIETSQLQDLTQLLNDAYAVSENGRKGPENTNLGGGNFQSPPKNRIDYLLLSKQIRVRDYRVYHDQYAANRYPSDHLPVSCVVQF